VSFIKNSTLRRLLLYILCFVIAFWLLQRCSWSSPIATPGNRKGETTDVILCYTAKQKRGNYHLLPTIQTGHCRPRAHLRQMNLCDSARCECKRGWSDSRAHPAKLPTVEDTERPNLAQWSYSCTKTSGISWGPEEDLGTYASIFNQLWNAKEDCFFLSIILLFFRYWNTGSKEIQITAT
jgi:hypothetical protein